jgi:hypothetical protein
MQTKASERDLDTRRGDAGGVGVAADRWCMRADTEAGMNSMHTEATHARPPNVNSPTAVNAWLQPTSDTPDIMVFQGQNLVWSHKVAPANAAWEDDPIKPLAAFPPFTSKALRRSASANRDVVIGQAIAAKRKQTRSRPVARCFETVSGCNASDLSVR